MAEPYLLRMLAVPRAPGSAPAMVARQNALAYQLRAHVSGRKPFTYLGNEERAAQAFPSADVARLREIKRARDPNGVFHSNYPVLK
jgi:FAD/FMN-containing dehydrogenase